MDCFIYPNYSKCSVRYIFKATKQGAFESVFVHFLLTSSEYFPAIVVLLYCVILLSSLSVQPIIWQYQGAIGIFGKNVS